MLKFLGLVFLCWLLWGMLKAAFFVWRIKQQFKKMQNNDSSKPEQPLAHGAIDADQCPKCGVFGNQPCQNADCPK